MAVPTLAFTPGAWDWICLTIVYVSIALHVVDPSSYADAVDGADSHFGKFDDIEFEEAEEERTMRKHSPFMSRCWACFKQERHKHSGALTFVDNTIMGVTTSLYFGVIGFAGSSPVHAVRTFPGRLIAVGFVLFSVVVLTNYTASSAADFVFIKAQSSAMLQDLDEVVATNRPICVRESLLSNMKHRYPHIPSDRFVKQFVFHECSHGG